MPKGCLHYAWLLTLLSCLIADAELEGQSAPLPHVINYTTEDGLPSTEVYCVLEDSRGYLWFGTDNGVVSYDGYEFVTYGPQEGLIDPAVFSLLEGPDGRLFAASGLSNQVFVWSDTSKRFSPHPVNTQLSPYPYSWSGTVVKLASVGQKDSLLIKAFKYGLAQYDGKERIYTPQGGLQALGTPGDPRAWVKQSVVLTNPITSPLMLADYEQPARGSTDKKIKETSVSYFSPTGKLIHRQKIPGIISQVKSFAFQYVGPSDTSLVFFAKDKAIYLQNKAGKRTYAYDILPLFPEFYYALEDGAFLLGGLKGGGVYHFNSLNDLLLGNGVQLIKNCDATFATQDRQGGIWVATLDKGCYYIPALENKIYNEAQGLPVSENISIHPLATDQLIAGYENNEVVIATIGTRGAIQLDTVFKSISQPRRFMLDESAQRIYSDYGVIRLDRRKQGGWILNELIPQTDIIRSYRPYRGDTLLISTYMGPTLFDAANQKILYDHLPAYRGKNSSLIRVNDYLVGYDGIHYVATHNGLYRYDKNRLLYPIHAEGVSLRDRIEEMVLLPDSSLLLATRGHGIIQLKEGWAQAIGKPEGLASDMIRHLHLAADTSLWVSTFSGISHIRFRQFSPGYFRENEGHHVAIRNYTTAHGLPSNEVNQTYTLGDQVWVATGSGFTSFSPPPFEVYSEPPQIRQVRVNGNTKTAAELLSLTAQENNLEIHYSTIDFKMRGDVNYRYRLREDAAWVRTKLRSVNLTAQPYGRYVFAVQSQNPDGRWSAAEELPFYIAPQFWDRTSVRALIVLLLIGLTALFFYLRQQRINNRKQLKQEITDLEQAALRAQMNPHFTFNCLNSINRFILKNEADEASFYLTKFAKLIRYTLNISVDDDHRLKDELDMLETYLSLEKLRFKNKIRYQLCVDPRLDTNSIRLPPLLIQPYVENALIHGISEYEEGGEVVVEVSPCAEGLRVSIIDNGVGFDQQQAQQKNRSVGMRITQQRLALMANSKDAAEVSIQTLAGRGTSVEIVIGNSSLA